MQVSMQTVLCRIRFPKNSSPPTDVFEKEHMNNSTLTYYRLRDHIVAVWQRSHAVDKETGQGAMDFEFRFRVQRVGSRFACTCPMLQLCLWHEMQQSHEVSCDRCELSATTRSKQTWHVLRNSVL